MAKPRCGGRRLLYVHQGAYVGYGRRVTFRIRSIHSSDLDSYGMGVVVAL